MLTQTAENTLVTKETPVALDDVTKRYGRRSGVAALERVSLSFAAGSFTAVLGVSGSGKSGVRAAAGVAPVALAAADPDLEQVYGEAVAGPLGRVLDLGVTSGRLTALRPGQVAVSTLEAASGAMGVHVGSRLTVYLPDGTPYRATVSVLYARSLASGDVLIPAAVTAGHTGTTAGFGQLLVSGGSAAQNGFANDLILGLVAAVFGWQAAFVIVTGLFAGAAAGTVALLAVTRAVTGSWAPSIPSGPAAGLVAAVIALTAGAVMIPFWTMRRREPSLTPA